MQYISYAAQSLWSRHKSIEDNIVFFGYNAVVERQALKPDLEMLEDGDATGIGARCAFSSISCLRLR